MKRPPLYALVLSSCLAACAGRPPPPTHHPRAPAHSATPTREPALGSLSLALHLYAAPPPARLLAKLGPGPRSPGTLLFPSPHRVVGRTFGSGRSRCHLALDLGARAGDPVLAAESGTVAYVGRFGTGGEVVMLVHPGGFVTVYAHLSSALVRPGDVVSRGHPIARSGSSGNATGPHLHFAVLVEGHPVDPLPLLDPRPTFVGDDRRFATPERAAQAWRHCPPKGRAYEGGD